MVDVAVAVDDAPAAASEVTVGVKVYQRTRALDGLLESIPTWADRVVVADDGTTADRARLYQQEWPFALDVLDLAYDAGVGAGRARIVEATETDLLLMVDPDHRLPSNVDVLVRQLDARPDLAGVAGQILEEGRVDGACHDFHEKRDGDVLVRGVDAPKTAATVAGYPLVEFHFVPQAILLRADALDDYAWDPWFTGEKDHIDFMLGQWHAGNLLAVSPAVVFGHDHSTDSATYQQSRGDLEAWYRAKQYVLDKWGYEQVVLEENSAAVAHPPPATALKRALPHGVQRRLNDIGDEKNRLLGRLRS